MVETAEGWHIIMKVQRKKNKTYICVRKKNMLVEEMEKVQLNNNKIHIYIKTKRAKSKKKKNKGKSLREKKK